VVELLLLAGAASAKRDALGSTALLEAAKAGQDTCMELLLKHGATLGLSATETAARLCECAANSDLPQLGWVAVAPECRLRQRLQADALPCCEGAAARLATAQLGQSSRAGCAAAG
jgi:ankyrin repeat protein